MNLEAKRILNIGLGTKKKKKITLTIKYINVI